VLIAKGAIIQYPPMIVMFALLLDLRVSGYGGVYVLA
jgi:hypothetical protein